MPALVALRDLSKAYLEGGHERAVLRGVHAEFAQGEFVAIRGRSGSGKTTLLNLIAGIDLPTGGEISIDGQDLNRMSDRERTLFRRRHIGIIFQFFHLIPTLSVLENVSLPAELAGVPAPQALERSLQLLQRVEMDSRAREYPDRLSGGEQQRVAVARALIQRPQLVLADEPTGNLDRVSAAATMSLLTELTGEQGACLLLVTHSRELAARADRQLDLREGVLTEEDLSA